MYCMEVFITFSFSLLSWTTIRCGAILQIPKVFHYCELDAVLFSEFLFVCVSSTLPTPKLVSKAVASSYVFPLCCMRVQKMT